MKFRLVKIVIISLISVAILGSTLSCNSSSGQSNNPTTSPTTPTPTQTASVIQVSNLAINPPEVIAGVDIIITARVTNTREIDQNYTAELRIDNTTKQSLPAFFYSDRVKIAPGVTQPLSVVISRDTPGTYKVSWAKLSGEFTVVQPEANPAPTGPALAPNFSGKDIMTGEVVSLAQYKGSVVLLNFVNYGCSESVNQAVSAQLLDIKELAKQRKDFIPLSVFCGCCPEETLRDFAKENGLTWHWILDSDNSITRKYTRFVSKFGYPTLIFVDKEQYIQDTSGYNNLAAMNQKIDTILQGN